MNPRPSVLETDALPTELLAYLVGRFTASKTGAHDRNRTGDLILTKDVLYQLSYMGTYRLGGKKYLKTGGEGWIRTSEGASQQIYSLPRLTASVPLHITFLVSQIWSGRRDLNPRPSAWKADALAAELRPHDQPVIGLEPTTY